MSTLLVRVKGRGEGRAVATENYRALPPFHLAPPVEHQHTAVLRVLGADISHAAIRGYAPISPQSPPDAPAVTRTRPLRLSDVSTMSRRTLIAYHRLTKMF